MKREFASGNKSSNRTDFVFVNKKIEESAGFGFGFEFRHIPTVKST